MRPLGLLQGKDMGAIGSLTIFPWSGHQRRWKDFQGITLPDLQEDHGMISMDLILLLLLEFLNF